MLRIGLVLRTRSLHGLIYCFSMKRAGRWLFNFAAAVSACLFLLVCVLWPLSYYDPGQSEALKGSGVGLTKPDP